MAKEKKEEKQQVIEKLEATAYRLLVVREDANKKLQQIEAQIQELKNA